MTVIASPLASFSAVVTQVGGTGVGFYALVEQRRADTVSGITDFDAALTFSAAFVGAYDNISQRVRWTGVRLVFDGSDLPPSLYYSRISEEETMVPGQQRTMRFAPISHLWAIPTDDYTPPAGSGDLNSPTGSESPPSSPPPGPTAAPISPRSWGNKPIELHLSFGASPRTMVESKLFQGVTLQKSNKGDVAITGDITCVDDSIKYANVPLCYQVPPFSNFTRDRIIRDMAANVGIPPEKVFVPAGGTITKPILLSNGSIVPFVNEFGAPENWFAYFDKNGNFVVEEIEMKTAPDWTIDARRGDYDYDAIEETPPAMPPTRYYVKGDVPVAPGSQPDAGTATTDDTNALYNPLCVKVRPSGGPSYLQGDGSYRSLPAAEEMVVARTSVFITTVDGRMTKKVTWLQQMYNPLHYDPNFDSVPPGTSYDGAYGDKTFHRDEVESLMMTQIVTIGFVYDQFGTLQRQVETTEGYYAPHRAGFYLADRVTYAGGGYGSGYFVYPGGTTRTIFEEAFQVTNRVETDYIYSSTGTLASSTVKTFNFFAPTGRCDIVADVADPVAPPVDVTPVPPPPSPVAPPPTGTGGTTVPPQPAFVPTITGPTNVFSNSHFEFQAFATGIPGGVVSSWKLVGSLQGFSKTTGVVGSTVSLGPDVTLAGTGDLAVSMIFNQTVSLPTSVSVGYKAYVVLTVNGSLVSSKLWFTPYILPPLSSSPPPLLGP